MIRDRDIQALGIFPDASTDALGDVLDRERAVDAAADAAAAAPMSRRTAVSLVLALVLLIVLWRAKFTVLGLGVAAVAYLSYTGGKIDTAKALKAARDAATAVVDVADGVAAQVVVDPST